MTLDPQNVIALVLTLMAVAYLSRRAWRAVGKSGGSCSSGCGSCSKTEAVVPGVVSIQPLSSSREKPEER